MATPQKRSNADGSTSWRVRFRIGGQQLGETFYSVGAAQEFCDWIRASGPERALEFLRQRVPVTDDTRSAPTLDEWAERYIESLTGASGGTKQGYRSSYRHSFGKHLGHLRIDVLDREAIARTIAKLQTHGGRDGKGYSDKSIANHHGLLSAMLTTAVHDGFIPSSPCDRVRLPRRTEHEASTKRFLTEDEFARIYEQLGVHHRPLVETLVGTGIRWGEAEALTVADVDLARARLRVNKAAKWSGDKGRRIVGPTKTRRSNRSVTLDRHLAKTLQDITEGRAPTERLFLAPAGGHLDHKVFWQDVWKVACERAGLTDPRPRIHDLRHTHASWLLAEGVPMKAVQERLGHESLSTTMDLYAHLMPGAAEEAATAMGKVWRKAKGKPALRAVHDVA